MPLWDRLRRHPRPAAFIAIAALGVAVTISRRPDAVANPQFFAEDGRLWYAGVYNDGWVHALLSSYNGYHQTISVVTAVAGQPLGLGGAPLLFNLVALCLQIAPALLLLSRRFEAVIPSLWTRCLIGALYLAIPNPEIHVNVTNAQWHLALLAFLVIVATQSTRAGWRAFDIGVLLLCGLSGPFIILLTPIAAAAWLARRGRWALGLAGVAAVFGLVQGLTAVTSLGTRSSAPLGASPGVLVHILVNRVLLSGLIGQQATHATFTTSWTHGTLLTAGLAIAGAAVVGLALWRGPLALRLLLLLAGLQLSLSLLKPMISLTEPQWPILAFTPGGPRYFLFGMLAWLVALVWLCTRAPRLPAALLTGTLLLVFCAGDLRHWQYPGFVDLHPSTEASQLTRARPGTVITLPINPAGWTMVLVRR